MTEDDFSLEAVRDFFENGIPFNKMLGMRLALAESGRARIELPFRADFIGDPTRPALHGGVISTLLDTIGGLAVWTKLSLRERVSTIDLRVDYLAPGRARAIVAEAEVVRIGNRVGVVDSRAFHDDAPEVTIATGKGVYSIKRPKQSE